MKTLLISLVIALGLFTATQTASAERRLENPVHNVVKLEIKKAKFVFSKPTTIQIKPCVDDARYECVYKLVGKRRNKEIKIYEYRAHDYVLPIYTTEEKVAAKN
ncbi:MAG: hypothetical protein QY323_00245 [Patescibacteria group bacterium]|nr:MAG: hypothetical protein QY323_00245 [Patescibacteria group bacterium]